MSLAALPQELKLVVVKHCIPSWQMTFHVIGAHHFNEENEVFARAVPSFNTNILRVNKFYGSVAKDEMVKKFIGKVWITDDSFEKIDDSDFLRSFNALITDIDYSTPRYLYRDKLSAIGLPHFPNLKTFTLTLDTSTLDVFRINLPTDSTQDQFLRGEFDEIIIERIEMFDEQWKVMCVGNCSLHGLRCIKHLPEEGVDTFVAIDCRNSVKHIKPGQMRHGYAVTQLSDDACKVVSRYALNYDPEDLKVQVARELQQGDRSKE